MGGSPGDANPGRGESQIAAFPATASHQPEPPRTNGKRPKRAASRKPGPFATVKFGSASVPIYRSENGGRTRFFLCHYRDGKRLRKAFNDLDAAKKEAQFVAQRIQSGMQHVTPRRAASTRH